MQLSAFYVVHLGISPIQHASIPNARNANVVSYTMPYGSFIFQNIPILVDQPSSLGFAIIW